ncbi:MAG TPA: molybdopterin cofactor-binding domain-containing protein [Terriglobales bacterium]|jgi:isoquinoline 1-oxidoreductase
MSVVNSEPAMTSFEDSILELRQHDQIARLNYGFSLNRRDLFKLLGGGLLVCCVVGKGWSQESGGGRHPEQDLPTAISGWLQIAEDGRITVFTGKAEMGQNIRTSLTQAVADELRVPVTSITLVMGDTALTPYDMGTFGSRTTPYMAPQLRRAGASAREALLALAAERLQSASTNLVVEDGKVTDRVSHKSLAYGELTRGQDLLKVINAEAALTPTTEWHQAGVDTAKIDGRAFVTGKHKYTSDLTRPGMLHGKILRASGFHAELASVDVSKAEAIAGVKAVHDGSFVGIVAPDERTAVQAIQAVQAKWSVPPQPSNANLFDHLRSHLDSDRPPAHIVGSVEKAFAQADKQFAQSYDVQFIAHTPLEPRAAVAEWQGEKVTVWTGTQRPFGVREELSQAFRIPLSNVRVIVPDTGSAYGGKHTGDAAIEAARLAKTAGKPVKLVWTRDEEFTWAYFRPAGMIDVKAGIQRDGSIMSWEFHNYNSGPAAIRTPYAIPNQHIEFHPADSPLREGSYRGLAATANFFAREVHMDELAHLVGIDPLQFRLLNLEDPRLRAVFEAAAKRFGWSRIKNSSSRGVGIAGGTEKGSYMATCVEIAVEADEIKIVRVVQAFECGAVVNPNGLENQVSGAIVQGLGGALFEAVKFENGKILNSRLAEYRVPRFSDTPQIEVEIVNRKDLPSAGAGETPLMGIAPAISNAIFAATGQRLRSLPLIPNGLKGVSAKKA